MNFDLLSAVQPENGWFAVAGISEDGIRQKLVATREEADAWVQRFLRQERNVFFGVAKYRDGSSRTKQNVQALKALWVDLDCGPGKDYPDQLKAFASLQKFCQTTGLPKPIIVNSGRGLHVYWPLDTDIPREEWEPLAGRLKEVCAAQGLKADPACFEAARILRVPGTYNFKGDSPLPVTVLSTADPVGADELRQILGVKQPVATRVAAAPKRALSALAQTLQSDIDKSFDRIMSRKDSCRQLKAALRERATLTEPRWFDALSIAKFCVDKDEAVLALSSDYPDYDPDETWRKVRNIKGPHTCDVFESNNPGGCEGCPHKGKIKSPVSLGKVVVEALEHDNTIEDVAIDGNISLYKIPQYPFPYVRGKHGGIYKKADTPEGEPVLIYPYDLYVVKRMRDPNEGGVHLIRSHTPKDGVEEFTIPNVKISDPAEVRKELARKDILLSRTKLDLLAHYIIRSAQELRHNVKAEHMRNQFGWADNDSKFIIGDREISAEGTYHSPPSSVTKALSEYMVPGGSFEKWKEVFDLYGREGMEPAAFAAATAFGAPLLKFSGQRGAIISMINTHSGTGKTTALYMCNSVWGHPEKLCAKKDDTFNSKVFKLGVYCNLPTTFDEMSNTDPKQLSELAYLITQGSGKDRMKASSNELRINLTTWQTIALCSSNHSFYEKLEKLKDSPQGELMRIIEYPLDYSKAIDTELGKKMFDHQLHENYGHAGPIYARFLVENYEEAKSLYETMQARIDHHLKLTQRERFWSATVAANLAGIHIAIRLGLLDWDISRIFKWACKMVLSLRKTTTPPLDDTQQVLGHFILQNIDSILVVNDGADRRSKLKELPLLEPRRELMMRFEPDTKRVFITVSAFRKYCADRSIGYREAIAKMKKVGLYKNTVQKRMTKGMKINMIPVSALEFDGSHSDFEPFAEMVESKISAPGEEPAGESVGS